jgi:hypothetical protein
MGKEKDAPQGGPVYYVPNPVPIVAKSAAAKRTEEKKRLEDLRTSDPKLYSAGQKFSGGYILQLYDIALTDEQKAEVVFEIAKALTAKKYKKLREDIIDGVYGEELQRNSLYLASWFTEIQTDKNKKPLEDEETFKTRKAFYDSVSLIADEGLSANEIFMIATDMLTPIGSGKLIGDAATWKRPEGFWWGTAKAGLIAGAAVLFIADCLYVLKPVAKIGGVFLKGTLARMGRPAGIAAHEADEWNKLSGAGKAGSHMMNWELPFNEVWAKVPLDKTKASFDKIAQLNADLLTRGGSLRAGGMTYRDVQFVQVGRELRMTYSSAEASAAALKGIEEAQKTLKLLEDDTVNIVKRLTKSPGIASKELEETLTILRSYAEKGEFSFRVPEKGTIIMPPMDARALKNKEIMQQTRALNEGSKMTVMQRTHAEILTTLDDLPIGEALKSTDPLKYWDALLGNVDKIKGTVSSPEAKALCDHLSEIYRQNRVVDELTSGTKALGGEAKLIDRADLDPATAFFIIKNPNRPIMRFWVKNALPPIERWGKWSETYLASRRGGIGAVAKSEHLPPNALASVLKATPVLLIKGGEEYREANTVPPPLTQAYVLDIEATPAFKDLMSKQAKDKNFANAVKIELGSDPVLQHVFIYTYHTHQGEPSRNYIAALLYNYLENGKPKVTKAQYDALYSASEMYVAKELYTIPLSDIMDPNSKLWNRYQSSPSAIPPEESKYLSSQKRTFFDTQVGRDSEPPAPTPRELSVLILLQNEANKILRSEEYLDALVGAKYISPAERDVALKYYDDLANEHQPAQPPPEVLNGIHSSIMDDIRVGKYKTYDAVKEELYRFQKVQKQ